MTTEATVVADIDSILAKLAADLDKVRAVADKVNTDLQGVEKNILVHLIPGLEPLITVVAEIAGGITTVIDALDDVADGLAANGGTVNPAKPVSAPTP